MDTYNIDSDSCSVLDFVKSASDTLGTKATTGDGELLGRIEFFGVNNAGTPAFAKGARIDCVQEGNAGATYIPGNIQFQTSDGTADVSTKMILKSDGEFGVGTTSPNEKMDVAGNIRTTGYLDVNGPRIMSGANAPSASAPDGSLYMRTDSGSHPYLYVRENCS